MSVIRGLLELWAGLNIFGCFAGLVVGMAALFINELAG